MRHEVPSHFELDQTTGNLEGNVADFPDARPRQPWGEETEHQQSLEELGCRFRIQGPVGLTNEEIKARQAYIEWRDGR